MSPGSKIIKNIIEELRTDADVKDSMRRAYERRLELFDNDILFFKEPFTPVTLTGKWCALKCKHCNSFYLGHMIDGSQKLFSIAVQMANEGARGILISGGSMPDGSVPTYELSDTILKIKKETGLKISSHTGIVNRSRARTLSKFLDMALVDVIGDDGTIIDILGIEAKVRDYENSLMELTTAGISIAPHIIVGLDKGRLKGEFRALEMIKKFDPAVIVIVVFIPTKNTELENISPPDLWDVVRVITRARQMFDVPLSLSCVRPGGRYRSMLDRYAILAGIDRIAVPSKNAYETSRELGLDITEIPGMCCSYS
jgi:lipoyl synthase